MSPYQLHLFGTRPLFSPRALKQYLDERKAIPVPDEEARMARLRDWLDALQEKVKHLDESGLEQKFNSLVLCEVLGYVLFPDKGCSAWPKPLSKVTKLGKKPDVILGSFGEETVIHAVLELKKPGVDLDAPQPRENPLSPVEQAFEYGEGILGVRWVLVSDMRVIRLYSVDSRTEFETFKLEACCQPNGHESFRSLYGLLSHENLVEGGRESSASRLFDKSHERQLRLRDSFYDVYYEIRADLCSAIQEAAIASGHTVNKAAALEATQRLLDRLLFLFYCEHHPNELIPRGTFSSVVEAAATLPGPNPHKVYDALKELFKEVDKGSSPASGIKLSGYNGELFKPHPVIDVIDLPDDLHRKDYSVSNDGQLRRVRGVWGLHSFDFWQELNEHLLGHIFEESLSDLVEMVSSTPVALEDKLKERKQHGIYFTHQLLAEFLTRSALRRHIDENAPRTNGESTSQEREEEAKNYQRRFDYLQTLKIADFACGSGAFLVSAYNVLLESFLQTEQRLFTLGSEERHGQLDWLALDADEKRKSLLRDCLYGQDLLPQAIEIAKLALWLRSARKGEKVLDLSSNLVCGDSLDTASTFSRLATHLGEYDVVLGNPPWGGDVDPSVFSLACSTLGLDSTISWDTWELFLLLSLAALKEGGRLALVLPDTFFSPDKSRTRELLVQQAQLEKVYNLDD